MRLSGGKPFLFKRSWVKQQRVVLLALIGANLGCFVAQLLLDTFQPGFVRDWLGLSSQGLRDAYAWQIATAVFLHHGPWHLVGDVFVLYFLGRDLESIFGQRHFFYLYMAGAVGGELGHLFLMPADAVLFGASGGIAAVLTAYATVLPELDLASMIFSGSPIRLRAKHVLYGMMLIGVTLLFVRRHGVVTHSAWAGGCAAGWLYTHILGFGQPSLLERMLQQRRTAKERYRQMSAEQFISEEIDPLLEKISKNGMDSLARSERRLLAQARDKILKRR